MTVIRTFAQLVVVHAGVTTSPHHLRCRTNVNTCVTITDKTTHEHSLSTEIHSFIHQDKLLHVVQTMHFPLSSSFKQ